MLLFSRRAATRRAGLQSRQGQGRAGGSAFPPGRLHGDARLHLESVLPGRRQPCCGRGRGLAAPCSGHGRPFSRDGGLALCVTVRVASAGQDEFTRRGACVHASHEGSRVRLRTDGWTSKQPQDLCASHGAETPVSAVTCFRCLCRFLLLPA